MRRKGFDWFELIIGLIFIVASIVAITNPESTLIAFVTLFGAAAIVRGVIRIVQFFKYQFASLLVVGIFDVIIGGIIMYNNVAGIIAMGYLFAVWFLADSVFTLVSSKKIKIIGTGYYMFTIVISIIGILIGIGLLFSPITAALTIPFMLAIYFLIFGVNSIIFSFTKNAETKGNLL